MHFAIAPNQLPNLNLVSYKGKHSTHSDFLVFASFTNSTLIPKVWICKRNAYAFAFVSCLGIDKILHFSFTALPKRCAKRFIHRYFLFCHFPILLQLPFSRRPSTAVFPISGNTLKVGSGRCPSTCI